MHVYYIYRYIYIYICIYIYVYVYICYIFVIWYTYIYTHVYYTYKLPFSIYVYIYTYIYTYIYIYIYTYLCNHKINVLSPWLSPQWIWNIYQNFMKIKHSTEMVSKICPNMKLTPPCTPLPRYMWLLHFFK